MQFKPCYVTAAQLDSLPKKAGQLIVVTDGKAIYMDESDSSRINVSSGINVLTNNVFWNDTTDITDDTQTPYSKSEIDDKIGEIVSLMAAL